MKKQAMVIMITEKIVQKQMEITQNLYDLPEACKTERKRLLIRKTLYDHAIKQIDGFGEDECFSEEHHAELLFLLKVRMDWYWIWRKCPKELYAPLSLYLYLVLYWQNHFLHPCREELERVLDPERQFTALVKLTVAQELIAIYQTCWKTLGGMTL